MEIKSDELSNIMDDIGVTGDMVNLRKHVYHLEQKLFLSLYHEYSIEGLFVGSQIEGSTTVGLKSDVDILLYTNRFCTGDYEDQLKLSYVRNRLSLPQCCSLKCPHEDILTSMGIGRSQQVNGLLKSTFIYPHFSEETIDVTQHKITPQLRGPAFNFRNYVDVVMAYYWHLFPLPDDCQVLFTRPKPGHWPKQDTLAKAKSHGMFLTLPGNIGCFVEYISSNQRALMHTQYAHDYVSVQFRMSTVRTERLLMSNLNIIQMKTYILTKMIRKQFLGPLVSDRLSTFHMKTSILFTIEEFPEYLWREENLVQYVIICLTTLRRFLKRRYCPHYMIADVNLFAEKLPIHDCQVLMKALTGMIDSKLTCLYELKFDDIGIRLAKNPDNLKLSSKFDNRSCIIMTLSEVFYNNKYYIVDKLLNIMNDQVEEFERLKYACTKLVQGKFKNEIEYFLHMVINTIASCEASSQISNGVPIAEKLIDEYEESLRSGNIANYLKYASMFVCTKQFDRAEKVLKIVESMITPAVVCASSGDRVKLSELQAQEGRLNSSEQIMEYLSKLAFEVYFSKLEVHCVPLHLRYEMCKTITELDKQETNKFAQNVFYDCAVIHAEPFLYYLQYLSSSRNEEKEKAYHKFINYVIRCPIKCRNATTMNMHAHIGELENFTEEAFLNYLYSIEIRPHNNAAYWHIFRLLGQYIYENNEHLAYLLI